MSESVQRQSVQHLMLEFLGWVASHPRTYADAMEAWKSSCPRHPVFEDAIVEGLIEIERGSSINDRYVTLTSKGSDMLARRV